MSAMLDPVDTGGDSFTLLKSANNIRLTKLWRANGTLDAYEDARNYRIQSRHVRDLRELSALLTKIEAMPDVCHVRGIPKPEAELQAIAPPELPGHYRRLKECYLDRPVHAQLFDIDKYEPALADPLVEPEAAIDEFIFAELGPEFQGVSYHWQLSSSAGRTPGVLKAHVWFWTEEAYTSDQMTRWARVSGAPIDKTVFRTVQVHYTANPVFEAGVADPVAARSGFHEGWLGDSLLLTMPDGAELTLVDTGHKSKDYPDARAKPGLIGAFCRAYSMDEVWDEFLPGQFERVPGSDRRVTWLQGGGAAEGCFVDDSQEWLVNTHDSSPHGDRAVCKWDLVRVYLFGDRDTPEVLADNFDVTTLPSHQAMIELVRSDERVQEELETGKGIAREQAVEAAGDWATQIDTAADETSVRDVCDSIIGDRSLDRVARELLANRVKTRMTSISGATFPIGVARGMVGIGRNVMAGGGGAGGGGFLVLPDISPLGQPQETEGNITALSEHLGVTIRYNVITKEDEIVIPGASWSMDNRVAASITHMRSECHRHEIRTTHLKKLITLIADRNLYNPVATWIESRPWDGVSRLEAFYDTIKEDPAKITKKLKHKLMRKWMISAIVAAMSPTGVQARGVLTFQGLQYIGKTRWIMALAPRELGLIKEGKGINPHDKDSMEQGLSTWIGELGEIDATFRKADIAALKAFITNGVDEFRRAYAEAKSQYARRTVFAASVNEEKFLVDATGNTRFWVIPTVSVDHEHGLDMQQVWAEFYEIWKSGEQHWLSVEDMEMLNHSNEQYSTPDPISEMLASHLDWDSFNPENCRWMQASDVLRWIGEKNPDTYKSTKAGKAILKLNGGLHRKSNGKRLSAVPLHRKGVFDDDFAGLGSESDATGCDKSEDGATLEFLA